VILPNHHLPLAILLLAALALTASPTRGDDTYTVRLSRRDRRGDKDVIERVSGRLVNDSTKYEGVAEPIERETISGYRLVADFKVLDADDAGNSLSEALTIRSWTATEEYDDAESPVLPRGAKVVARAGSEKTQYTVDGAKPNKRVLRHLESVLSLSPADKVVHNDDVFGSKERRKIGETWPINREKAAELYSDDQSIARPQDISGTVTLVGLETYNGRRCLRIAADVKIDKFQILEPVTTKPTTPTTAPSPLKMTVVSLLMSNHTDWLVDLEGERQREWISFSSIYHYVMEGSYGGPRFHTVQTVRRDTQIRSLRDVATTATAPAPVP